MPSFEVKLLRSKSMAYTDPFRCEEFPDAQQEKTGRERAHHCVPESLGTLKIHLNVFRVLYWKKDY